MELERTALPVLASLLKPPMETPTSLLKAMVLPAPVAVPPIVLLDELEKIDTPFPLLAKADAPVISVPIKFPCTVFDDEPEIETPSLPLPEITLPAPAAVPPIVLPVAPCKKNTPLLPLGIAILPVISVPIKFPCTIFDVALVPNISIPPPPLPEIILGAPAAVPPIILLSPLMAIPIAVLPGPLDMAAVPAALVPIKFPCTLFDDPPIKIPELPS